MLYTTAKAYMYISTHRLPCTVRALHAIEVVVHFWRFGHLRIHASVFIVSRAQMEDLPARPVPHHMVCIITRMMTS